MIGSSKGGERELSTLPVLRGNNNGDGICAAGSRNNQPYAKYCTINDGSAAHMESAKNNSSSSVRVMSSPMLKVGRSIRNDDDDDVGSSVTVQARYRVQSPAMSAIPSEMPLSTSPPCVLSGNSSFYGDGGHGRYVPSADCSAAIPIKSESNVCTIGSSGMRPFSAKYSPAAFSMPPVLACNAFMQKGEQMVHSPHLESLAAQHCLGSPPTTFGGADYKSPLSLSFSPPYHGDFSSIRSPTVIASGCDSMRIAVCGGEKILQERKGRNNGVTSDTTSSFSESSSENTFDSLKLCPNDDHCADINDRKHQQMFAHTCRLFPCYHGHIRRHAKLFRHMSGQIAQAEALASSNGVVKKIPAEALVSVSFSSISPEAQNAYGILVTNLEQSYKIFGDWNTVRVHTFKRYLHQVYKISPTVQMLVLENGDVPLDDDIRSVSSYGVVTDSVIIVKRKEDAELSLLSISER